MNDVERRIALQRRIDDLNAALAEYFEDAHESLADARRQVASSLDDARVLLQMKSDRPDYFLPMCEMFLNIAERQFETSRRLIDQYGGPATARMVGGR